MSRPSFRPRPIDLTKPLPIIKSSKDLRNEDDVVVNRALPQIATGVDPAEEEERHLQQALLASVYGDATSKPVDIPIPVFAKVVAVSYPQRTGVFRRPHGQYIKFDKSDEDMEHATVDYDADFEDEQFVAKFNVKHPAPPGKDKSLGIGQLEVALDVLEKQQSALENEDKIIVPYAAVRSALAGALSHLSDTARRAVYAHWAGRRERHPEPFLRIYQKQPDPSDTNPAVAFRPRDKDSAAANGRRLNTYENFKRAQTLRDELIRLRKILRTCIDRDKRKLELLSVSCLQQRLQLLTNGGPRVELIVRRSLAASRETVVLVPGTTHTAALAVKDLRLPNSVEVVQLPEDLLEASLAAIATEKVPKRAPRRTSRPGDKSRSETDSIAEMARQNARAVGQTVVDNFGFDELGNRFLKHMRYLAGGFMTHGVCPYDHRVFAAASERNTVRELPHAPQPFNFPSPQVEFARLPDDEKARMKAAREAFEAAREGRLRVGDGEGRPPAPKRPRTMRVRGRVGRGGRIIFDRVTYERERGVKAASYPASVEAGGVYTGGIPLEMAPRMVRKGVEKGALGNLALLAPRELDDSTDEEADDDYSVLARPMKPLAHLQRVAVEQSRWPHRRNGRGGGAKRGRSRAAGAGQKRESVIEATTSGRGDDEISGEKGMRLRSWTRAMRALPAYSAMNDDALVTEVGSDVSTPSPLTP